MTKSDKSTNIDTELENIINFDAAQAQPQRGKMMIQIQTKSQQQRQALLDGLRIMAWKQFKAENPDVRGLDGYELFKEAWNQDSRHQMTFNELCQHIKELEFTPEEVMAIRENYYAQRNNLNNNNVAKSRPAFQNVDPAFPDIPW